MGSGLSCAPIRVVLWEHDVFSLSPVFSQLDGRGLGPGRRHQGLGDQPSWLPTWRDLSREMLPCAWSLKTGWRLSGEEGDRAEAGLGEGAQKKTTLTSHSMSQEAWAWPSPWAFWECGKVEVMSGI